LSGCFRAVRPLDNSAACGGASSAMAICLTYEDLKLKRHRVTNSARDFMGRFMFFMPFMVNALST
jgi:hypothetical protein